MLFSEKEVCFLEKIINNIKLDDRNLIEEVILKHKTIIHLDKAMDLMMNSISELDDIPCDCTENNECFRCKTLTKVAEIYESLADELFFSKRVLKTKEKKIKNINILK